MNWKKMLLVLSLVISLFGLILFLIRTCDFNGCNDLAPIIMMIFFPAYLILLWIYNIVSKTDKK